MQFRKNTTYLYSLWRQIVIGIQFNDLWKYLITSADETLLSKCVNCGHDKYRITQRIKR